MKNYYINVVESRPVCINFSGSPLATLMKLRGFAGVFAALPEPKPMTNVHPPTSDHRLQRLFTTQPLCPRYPYDVYHLVDSRQLVPEFQAFELVGTASPMATLRFVPVLEDAAAACEVPAECEAVLVYLGTLSLTISVRFDRSQKESIGSCIGLVTSLSRSLFKFNVTIRPHVDPPRSDLFIRSVLLAEVCHVPSSKGLDVVISERTLLNLVVRNVLVPMFG